MALAARLDKCRCHSVAVHLLWVRERALGVGVCVYVCVGRWGGIASGYASGYASDPAYSPTTSLRQNNL